MLNIDRLETVFYRVQSNAECLCKCSVDTLDHQAALSRSLEDFSAISPAMQRVVRGYHGTQQSFLNGTNAMGANGRGFDGSFFSPHPSPTVESHPHRSSSCDTLVSPLTNGGSGANNPRAHMSSATAAEHHRPVSHQQSVLGSIDHTLAALFAVGIAVVLAIIFILLGQDSAAATVSIPDLEPDLGAGAHF